MAANKILDREQIIEDLVQYETSDHNGYRCGLKGLDDIIRLDKNSLVICVARPSDGKSTFLNYYSYLMAKQNNWKTLYIPFETPRGKQIKDLYNYYGDLQEVIEHSVFLADTTFSNIEELYTTIKEVKETKGIDLIILDTFTNLIPLLNDYNTNIIGGVLTQFTQIAKELNICVIITTHPTKMKREDEIDAYSICGSANFFNLADYIFSIKVTDREQCLSEITTHKIRNNFDCGLCGQSISLQYDPITKTYAEPKENDIPFGSYLENMCKSKQSYTTTSTTQIKPIETIKICDNVINVKEEKERIESKKKVSESILTDTNISVFQMTPQGQTKLKDTTLFDAIHLGNEHKAEIQKLRQIDRNTNEKEYKRLKLQLPMFTVSCLCGSSAKDLDKYTKIICVDIDEKDNPQKSIEELRKKVNNLPYTLYSSLSVGGKGLYILVAIDGEEKDFLPHFKALQYEFSQMGITIDKSCKNLNRLRVISFDTAAYYNEKAQIYTKTKIDYPKVTCNEKKQPYKNNHTSNDKANFEMALKDIEKRGLIITHNHQETLDLSNCLASVFDEEGRKYLHIIRKQREGYDEYKLDECFNTSIDYVEQGHKYTLGTFYKYYNQVK